ncbi:hypothetical protein BH10PSE18_BH10PSE18_45100 [soil metagenome]
MNTMRGGIDLSSWQGAISTLLGLILVSLVAVGIRLLVMHSVQQRRERQNRQVNERLKILIAAYKTLGGSFTGDLAVDPSHLRQLRAKADAADAALERAEAAVDATVDAHGPSQPALATSPRPATENSDRRRRIRDAVEAALSDVILLGTEEQVQLAVRAANDMVAGRVIETSELVASLRTFIRDVLDLESLPPALAIPKQGPVRVSGTASSRNRSGQNAGGGSGGSGGGGGGGGGRGGADQGGGSGHGDATFAPRDSALDVDAAHHASGV